MIIISPDIILSDEQRLTLNNPLVGYNNVVSFDNITASSQDASNYYPPTNLANPATYSLWQPDSGGAQWLQIVPGDAEVEYVGLARHNLATRQASLAIFASSGAQDDDGNFIFDIALVPEQRFETDAPIILRFTRGTYVALRIAIGPTFTGDPIRLAVVYCGTLFPLQRRLYVGHAPLAFADATATVNSVSDSGEFLGRLLTSQTKSTSVSLKNISPNWYREKFRPFQDVSIKTPFFFAWRPQDYPNEVGYCWLNGDPKMTNALPNGMVSVDFNLGGIGNLSP